MDSPSYSGLLVSLALFVGEGAVPLCLALLTSLPTPRRGHLRGQPQHAKCGTWETHLLCVSGEESLRLRVLAQ